MPFFFARALFLRKGEHYALLLDALYTTHQRGGHRQAVDVDDDALEDFRRFSRQRRRRRSQRCRSPPLLGALLVKLDPELGALDCHVRAEVQSSRSCSRSRRRHVSVVFFSTSRASPLAAVGASWAFLHICGARSFFRVAVADLQLEKEPLSEPHGEE